MTSNFHTHTTFCDGRDSVEAMAEAALKLGFAALGFSSHSDMLADISAYVAEVRRVARAFEGRLKVFCGVEAELAKPYERGSFDYVIGSHHFITAPDGAFFEIDHTSEILFGGIDAHFGGDTRAFVSAYYAALKRTLSLEFEIVGHVDLIRKFNASRPYFDEQSDWYRGEVEAMADAIAKSGKLVEVNTGAISRGWLDDAYPSPFFRDLLRARGVKFVLSSDAHASDALDCAFDRFSSSESYVNEEFLRRLERM